MIAATIMSLVLGAARVLAGGPTAAGQEVAPEDRQRIEQAVPREAPARPRAPRRLLVINLNVRDGVPGKGHPSIPYGNLAINLMGRATGAYAAVFSDDPAVFGPERLKDFDAVCFNNTAGVLFEDPHLRKSLLEFVAKGKGFIGIHAAAATFVQWPKYDQWPAFGEMLGGYEDGGHPWKANETVSIRVDDPGHPVNAAFGGKGFQVSDEIFQFRAPYARDRVRVLLSIDTERTDMNPSRRFLPERARDRDFPVSWVRRYGEGRVFYCSLGHNPQTFWNPAILRHYLAGIQYALGDLAADGPAPSGGRPAGPPDVVRGPR